MKNKSIGKIIKEFRISNGMTEDQFSDLTGLHKSAITSIETGSQISPDFAIEKIRNAFGNEWLSFYVDYKTEQLKDKLTEFNIFKLIESAAFRSGVDYAVADIFRWAVINDQDSDELIEKLASIRRAAMTVDTKIREISKPEEG